MEVSFSTEIFQVGEYFHVKNVFSLAKAVANLNPWKKTGKEKLTECAVTEDETVSGFKNYQLETIFDIISLIFVFQLFFRVCLPGSLPLRF